MDNKGMPSHHSVRQDKYKKHPNETLRILNERASCRRFSDRSIEPEIMEQILEAGIHSPTGGNLQPYSIIKIENAATRNILADMCGQKFIGEAPVNLLFCIDWYRLKRWSEVEKAPFSAMSSFRHFWISFQDTIICAQNICTAAAALGLGSVYIGTIMDFFREAKDMFKLPKGVFPVVLLCLGYRKASPVVRRKLDVNTIVHNEEYRDLSDSDLIAVFNEKYPDIKIEITDKRLARIQEVCNIVHGREFYKECLSKIEKNGYINAAQRYFGLHYCADMMPEGNDDFLKIMEEYGFDWFEEYRPHKEE
ncbi:MAG: nitroreductase family protein [bacterium]